MFLGRYQLGQYVPLTLQCVGADRAVLTPTAAPTFSVYSSNGTKVVSDKKVPPRDLESATGLFGFELRLSSSYSAGLYTVLWKWADGSFSGRRTDHFAVIAGGNANGPVSSIYQFEPPFASILAYRTDAGFASGRNPRV